MFKNKLGEDSPIPKFIHRKIRRRGGVKSLTTLVAALDLGTVLNNIYELYSVIFINSKILDFPVLES